MSKNTHQTNLHISIASSWLHGHFIWHSLLACQNRVWWHKTYLVSTVYRIVFDGRNLWNGNDNKLPKYIYILNFRCTFELLEHVGDLSSMGAIYIYIESHFWKRVFTESETDLRQKKPSVVLMKLRFGNRLHSQSYRYNCRVDWPLFILSDFCNMYVFCVIFEKWNIAHCYVKIRTKGITYHNITIYRKHNIKVI